MNIKKLVSMITAICFLFSSIGPNIASASLNEINAKTYEKSIGFIPVSLGKVIETAFFEDSDYTVVNIMDLHCHTEVQKNISSIIENLQQDYNISAIFLEGGYDKVNTDIFKSIKNEGFRNSLIEAIINKGRLTGTEYFFLKNESKIPFFGLEDKDIHKENLKRLSNILNNKEIYKEILSKVKSEIDYLKAKNLSFENKKFNRFISRYKAGEILPQRYYSLLRKYINKINKDEDRYNSFLSMSLEKYPVFNKYCTLLNYSKEINFDRATYEMQVFLDELKTVLPYKHYNELSLKTARFSNIEEVAMILHEISKEYGLHINENSSLSHLISYVYARKMLNPIILLDEERRIIEDIRVAFSNNPTEIEISFLSDFYSYLESFLYAEITPDDYEFFVKEYEQFEKIYKKYAFENHLAVLNDDISFLINYYEINKVRNDIFVKNIKDNIRPSENKNNLVIVVAGGFHTEGLNKLFKDNKISYISIMPSVTQETKTAEENFNRFLSMDSTFTTQTLALSLASQANNIEIVQMMIDLSMGMESFPYNEENMRILSQSVSEALGEQVAFSFTSEETELSFNNGFKATIKNNDGKIENATIPEASVAEKNSFNIDEILQLPGNIARFFFSGILEMGESQIFSPDAYKILKNIMEFAAKNNLITGDGLIFEIETDPSLGDKIDEVDLEMLARMPENLQQIILKYHNSKENAKQTSGFMRAFLTAYFNAKLDPSIIDHFFSKRTEKQENKPLAIVNKKETQQLQVEVNDRKGTSKNKNTQKEKFVGYKSLISANRAAMSALGASKIDDAFKYLSDMIEDLDLIDPYTASKAKTVYVNILEDWNNNKDIKKHSLIDDWNESNLEDIKGLHTLINAVHQLGLKYLISASQEISSESDYVFKVSSLTGQLRQIDVWNYSDEEISPQVRMFINYLLNIGKLYYTFSNFYVYGNTIICSSNLGGRHSVDIMVDLDSDDDGIISGFYDTVLTQRAREGNYAESRIGRIFGLSAFLLDNGFNIVDYQIDSGIQVRYSVKDKQNLLSEYAEKLFILASVFAETGREGEDIFRIERGGYGKKENEAAAKLTTADFRNNSKKLRVGVLGEYLAKVEEDLEFIFKEVDNARNFLRPVYDALGITENKRYPEEIDRYVAEGRAIVDYEARTASLNKDYNSYERFTKAFAEFDRANKEKARDLILKGYAIENIPYEDLFFRTEAIVGDKAIRSGWLQLKDGRMLSVKVVAGIDTNTIYAAYVEIVNFDGMRNEITYAQLKEFLESEGYKIAERKSTDDRIDKELQSIIDTMKYPVDLTIETGLSFKGRVFAKGTGNRIQAKATYDIENNSQGKILILEEFSPNELEKASAGEGVIVRRGNEVMHSAIGYREKGNKTGIIKFGRWENGELTLTYDRILGDTSSYSNGYEVWEVSERVFTIKEGTDLEIDGSTGKIFVGKRDEKGIKQVPEGLKPQQAGGGGGGISDNNNNNNIEDLWRLFQSNINITVFLQRFANNADYADLTTIADAEDISDKRYEQAGVDLSIGVSILKRYTMARNFAAEVARFNIKDPYVQELLNSTEQDIIKLAQERLAEIKTLLQSKSLTLKQIERALALIEEASYWQNYYGNRGIQQAIQELSEKIKREESKTKAGITDAEELNLNDISEYGAKSVKAGFLSRIVSKLKKKMGVKIFAPKGIAIGKSTFERYMASTAYAQLIKELENARQSGNIEEVLQKAAEIERLISTTDNGSIKKEIIAQLGLKDAVRYAVRSSGIGEDGRDNAFAGMGESYLNLNKDEVFQHILKVWASFFSKRSIIYMLDNDLNVAPAVLVQDMVEKVAKSGVSLNGLIGSVFGLGEGIVSGRFDGDMAHVTNEGTIEYVKAQSRSGKIVIDERGGTKAVSLEKFERGNRVLSQEEVLLLDSVQSELEAELGYPVDMEWSIDESGDIHILQVRPVTDFVQDHEIDHQNAAETDTDTAKLTLPILRPVLAILKFFKVSQKNIEAVVSVLELPFAWRAAFDLEFENTFISWHGKDQTQVQIEKRKEGISNIRNAMLSARSEALQKTFGNLPFIRTAMRSTFIIASMISANIKAHIEHNLNNPDAKLTAVSESAAKLEMGQVEGKILNEIEAIDADDNRSFIGSFNDKNIRDNIQGALKHGSDYDFYINITDKISPEADNKYIEDIRNFLIKLGVAFDANSPDAWLNATIQFDWGTISVRQIIEIMFNFDSQLQNEGGYLFRNDKGELKKRHHFHTVLFQDNQDKKDKNEDRMKALKKVITILYISSQQPSLEIKSNLNDEEPMTISLVPRQDRVEDFEIFAGALVPVGKSKEDFEVFAGSKEELDKRRLKALQQAYVDNALHFISSDIEKNQKPKDKGSQEGEETKEEQEEETEYQKTAYRAYDEGKVESFIVLEELFGINKEGRKEEVDIFIDRQENNIEANRSKERERRGIYVFISNKLKKLNYNGQTDDIRIAGVKPSLSQWRKKEIFNSIIIETSEECGFNKRGGVIDVIIDLAEDLVEAIDKEDEEMLALIYGEIESIYNKWVARFKDEDFFKSLEKCLEEKEFDEDKRDEFKKFIIKERGIKNLIDIAIKEIEEANGKKGIQDIAQKCIATADSQVLNWMRMDDNFDDFIERIRVENGQTPLVGEQKTKLNNELKPLIEVAIIVKNIVSGLEEEINDDNVLDIVSEKINNNEDYKSITQKIQNDPEISNKSKKALNSFIFKLVPVVASKAIEEEQNKRQQIYHFDPIGDTPSDNELYNDAANDLTLPETGKVIEERGYTGIKKYLYTGIAELRKFLFTTSQDFADMHDNISDEHRDARKARADILKFSVASATVFSIGVIGALVAPIMGLAITTVIMLASITPLIAFWGITIHAFNNFIEDYKAQNLNILNLEKTPGAKEISEKDGDLSDEGKETAHKKGVFRKIVEKLGLNTSVVRGATVFGASFGFMLGLQNIVNFALFPGNMVFNVIFGFISALFTAISAGVAANAITRIGANFRHIKGQISMIDIAGYSIAESNGEISVPVFLINNMPANPEKFGFENSGVKIDGKSIWISSESSSLVIFVESNNFAEIGEAIKNKNRKINRTLSKLIKTKMGINIKPQNIEIDWINIDADQDRTSMTYDENGEVRLNLSAEDSNLGANLFDFITGIRAVQNADKAAAIQNIYYLLDNIESLGDLSACLDDFQRIGNGQIILDYSVIKNNLSEKKIREFFNAAHSNGIKVIADLTNSDMTLESCIDIGFDGYMAFNADKKNYYIHDFALSTETEANIVENYTDSKELEEELSKTQGIKIIKNSQIVETLANDRSIIDRFGFMHMLKGSRLLAVLKKDIYSESFIKNAAYNLKEDYIPSIKDESLRAELIIALENKDIERAKEILSVVSNHAISAYMDKIYNNVNDKNEALLRQLDFLEAITEKMLVKQEVVGELVNKELEKTLGKALRIRLYEKIKGDNNDSKIISADEFRAKVSPDTLEWELDRKINELAMKGFDAKPDTVALNSIIELIPAIADVRFNIKVSSESLKGFDVRSMQNILSAA